MSNRDIERLKNELLTNKIELSDTISQFMEKCNNNFSAIIEWGGGPAGEKGDEGEPGIPTKPKVPIHIWRKGIEYDSEIIDNDTFTICYSVDLTDSKYQEGHLIMLKNAHVYILETNSEFKLTPKYIFTLQSYDPSTTINGENAYMHIAYANSPDGDGFVTDQELRNENVEVEPAMTYNLRRDVNSNNSSTNKIYMGVYSDNDPTPSQNPSSYTWVKIQGDAGANGKKGEKGDKGDPGEQGPKGEQGETGKLGKVTYPAGLYNENKLYILDDVKTPYVICSDDNYYMLKSVPDNKKYWAESRKYYNSDHNTTGKDVYKYISVVPDDYNLSTRTSIKNYEQVTDCNNDNFNDKWDEKKPPLNMVIASLTGTYKYIEQSYKYEDENQIVGNVVWTLNPDKTEVILASKFLYSKDGTPENIIDDINDVYFSGKSPIDDNENWEIFESFEAIHAKIGIIKNGTIGSAVYSGDFMFSQEGVDKDGNTSPHFENFNPEHIYDSESTFKPNICMDFNTGQMWAAGGNIEMASNGDINMNGNINMDGNINLQGNVSLNGMFIKTTTVISNTADFSKYVYSNNNLIGDGYSFDLIKCGTYIVFKYLPSNPLNINLPSLQKWVADTSGGYWTYNDDVNEKRLCRSISGNEFVIYNNNLSQTSKISFKGCLMKENEYFINRFKIQSKYWDENDGEYKYKDSIKTEGVLNEVQTPLNLSLYTDISSLTLTDNEYPTLNGYTSCSITQNECLILKPIFTIQDGYESLLWLYNIANFNNNEW